MYYWYLVTEMYDARGLSTRDIEDTFTDDTGKCLISKSAVSQVADNLWEGNLAFTKREQALMCTTCSLMQFMSPCACLKVPKKASFVPGPS